MPEEKKPLTLFDLVDVLHASDVEARVFGDGAACVDGMAIDSREVAPRNLFVCKGAGFRPAFLESAVAAGAAAYLCEGVGEGLSIPSELVAAAAVTPALVVSDVRRAMALVAPVIYRHPEDQLHVVGITGTKGKSTVAYMLRSILVAAGQEPSILGSIETDDGKVRYESHNTTPEAPDLWRHLRNTVDAGRRTMVMEVSSQGLKYDRVLGLPFEIGCFLNIGRDHISGVEHPDFEDYFASKLRIFNQCEVAVVNLATDHVDRVLQAAKSAPCVATFAVEHAGEGSHGGKVWPVEPLFIASGVTQLPTGGLAFTVRERAAEGEIACEEHIELGMPGLFNVDNALAAISMARLLGVGYDAIRAGLAQIRVPGRMELVSSADGHVLAIVDYAHNELSFETLFKSVKAEYPDRRVVALFGAPGGKAQERREALPRVAGAYADHLVYTEEDPAHDRVEDICAELVKNTPAGVSHEVILDREEAVRTVLERALACGEPSVVLLLAKGDEETMHRGDEYPEVKSDLAIAREVLLR
ncbi:Mur ligase family protein [Collinsella stercoris]|nr:UDP-N-acetylmuramyl-tripeptide synthetase [Collinsella stercoris]UEA45392.1 UDP-N-acetylmuramyl-tripeptide synthetase [Collinsella stercoris DSM 13279]UWP12083.1 UDP-N-acetylmuramyl-tripeptide synthetase [Collinsella stercoris]